MAKRVFELARELDVTSKDVLTKCRAEGLNLKNHMASLSAGLEATIREWFSDAAESHTAVETAEHVDLEEMRKKARRKRKKKAPEPAEAVAEAPQTVEGAEAPEAEPVPTAGESPEASPDVVEAPEPVEAQATEVTQAPAPAPAESVPLEPSPAPSEAAAAVEAEPASREPVVESTPQAPVKGEPAEVAAEAPDGAVSEPVEQAPKVHAEASTEPVAEAEQQAPAEPAAPVAEDKQAPPAESPESASQEGDKKEQDAGEDEEVQPAGPQLVPRPAELKGPRVVRMERPDYVPAPTRSRRSPSSGPPGQAPPGQAPRRSGRTGGKGAAPPAPDMIDLERKGRRKTRRSPRRKGRSAESGSGERIREWREKDLQERSQRLAAAGSGLRRHRPSVGQKRSGGPSVKSGKIEIEEPITIKSLSAATGVKSSMIIKRLMRDGILATVNQGIETEMAETIMLEYGIELQVKAHKSVEDEMLEQFEQREKSEQKSRAPVVTFLGHVDHGKTSLLDYIRKATVAEGEAGGITQHIGSYRYDRDDVHVVFLDTPGHEAFTAMRARGANMTDVVVLVVAADDGVMPQTVEAINHAKAAGVPIVVALNKIDVPNANVNRALGQLAEHDLQPRQWGGDTEVIETSAINGDGMDTLVETLSLEAELLELQAEYDAPASGYVIEGEMDPGRGVVARLLVLNGTLKVGDPLICGNSSGRVRQILDDRGRTVEQSGPATPVEVTGLDSVPGAGDRFYVTDDIDQARTVAEHRVEQKREQELAMASAPAKTLESLFSQIEAGQIDELTLVVKADVQGSLEALRGQLEKLSHEEIRVNILHAGVGGVNTGDVTLAEASNAMIVAFNVVADASARRLAESKNVEIRNYRVIYDITEDIRKLLEEGLAPEIREETLGRAEIRQVFKSSKVGNVAGCMVTDGVVQRNALVRITRDNVIVEDGRELDSLRRYKDDVREVRAGMECGLVVAGYDDVKEGDILEFYKQVEVARTL